MLLKVDFDVLLPEPVTPYCVWDVAGILEGVVEVLVVDSLWDIKDDCVDSLGIGRSSIVFRILNLVEFLLVFYPENAQKLHGFLLEILSCQVLVPDICFLANWCSGGFSCFQPSPNLEIPKFKSSNWLVPMWFMGDLWWVLNVLSPTWCSFGRVLSKSLVIKFC